MIRRRQVVAFIDWNSQIANAGQRGEVREERKASRTLDYVVEKVASTLSEIDRDVDLFQVEMRLYHGWHRGLSETDSRRAIGLLAEKRELPSMIGKARFDWGKIFGNTLVDAFDHRKHPRLRIHLPNTLRTSLTGGPDREKMVDGALMCDLLCCARSDPGALRLIFAEDDDVIPAIFVSERWGKDHQGKTILARARADTGFLALEGLLRPL
jgi:hypothetical protein